MVTPVLSTDESQEQLLQSLLVEHLERKQKLFSAINHLVAQLYDTQRLLEHHQSQEALLMIEQLVCEGEAITRQF